MRFLVLSILATILSFNAHAQSSDQRLDRLERELQTMSQFVYQGGQIPAATVTPTAPQANTAYVANLDARVGELDERTRRITGSLEQLNHRINQIEQLVATLNNRLSSQDPSTPSLAAMKALEDRIIELENKLKVMNQAPQPLVNTQAPAPINSTQNSQVPNQPLDVPQSSLNISNASKLYDLGFNAIKEKDFEKAEEYFVQFLDSYSDHNLASNAQYWLGETYYVRDMYPQAARAFAKGYQDDPQGSKAPDNLLKLSLSLYHSEQKEQACVTLSQLVSNFTGLSPNIVSRANVEQEKMNCNGAN